MVEPFASDRLRRVLGSAPLSTELLDPDRETPLLAALEPPAAPSAALADAMARCPSCAPGARCTVHDGLWRDERWRTELLRHREGERFASGYEAFRDRALASEPAATSMLSVLRLQADALAQVWEAHRRGAVTLPAPVLEAVLAAQRAMREQRVVPA